MVLMGKSFESFSLYVYASYEGRNFKHLRKGYEEEEFLISVYVFLYTKPRTTFGGANLDLQTFRTIRQCYMLNLEEAELGVFEDKRYLNICIYVSTVLTKELIRRFFFRTLTPSFE